MTLSSAFCNTGGEGEGDNGDSDIMEPLFYDYQKKSQAKVASSLLLLIDFVVFRSSESQ